MIGSVSEVALGGVALGGGAATVFAQAIPLPDGFSTWPATAISGLITLTSLGLLAYKIKQDAAAAAKTSDAITALSVSIQAATDAQKTAADKSEQVASAMMNRPCLVHKE